MDAQQLEEKLMGYVKEAREAWLAEADPVKASQL